jgi:hypothetical protein
MPTKDAQLLIYTPATAAALLHPDLSPRTLERWRQQGTGPAFVKIGRRIAYTHEALLAFREDHTHRHTASARTRGR